MREGLRSAQDDLQPLHPLLLENYYLPGDLETQIGNFVAHYHHLRCHESIAG